MEKLKLLWKFLVGKCRYVNPYTITLLAYTKYMAVYAVCMYEYIQTERIMLDDDDAVKIIAAQCVLCLREKVLNETNPVYNSAYIL